LKEARSDKQLRGLRLKEIMAKRRLEQALNCKEFAVSAGVSYSTARDWFRLPGFPVFHGVVFWQDFTEWRRQQNGLNTPAQARPVSQPQPVRDCHLPPQAQKILQSA
jgi:hypothetical protein